MSPEERRSRGDEAKRLLESKLWLEAWDSVRAVMLRKLEDLPQEDAQSVMGAKAVLSGMRLARQYMERVVADGVVAVKEIEQAERAKRIKR